MDRMAGFGAETGYCRYPGRRIFHKSRSMAALAVMRLVALALVAAPAALAVEAPGVSGSVSAINTDTWRISGLETSVGIDGERLHGKLRIDSIELAGWPEPLRDVGIDCHSIRITTRAFYCDGGRFDAVLPALGPWTAEGSFSWESATAVLRLNLTRLPIASGTGWLSGIVSDNDIDVRFAGEGLQLTGLLDIANRLGFDLAGLSATGAASIEGRLRWPVQAGARVELNTRVEGMALANESGTIATEAVAGRLQLDLQREPGASRFNLLLEADRGEAYLEPVYANFTEHAFRLRARDVSTGDFRALEVAEFELAQDTLLRVAGNGSLRLPGPADEPPRLSATLEVMDTAIDTVYSSLLQVGLAGTILGDLETAGRVSGNVRIVDNRPTSASLEFRDAIIDDKGGRFAVYGLAGTIDWPGLDRDRAGSSMLRWDSGTLFSILVEGGATELLFGDNDVELLAPLRIETMGGALRINQLALRDFGTAAATGVLDAELEPIQLGQLSSAFGWPAFSGQLSGRLPLLALAGDEITVGGTLAARAFDGNIEVSNLRIEHPFSRVPRLQADVSMRGLDLERLTDTFSFGLIQGRLSTDIAGLQLVSWKPVAMDLHIYTPAGDRSRRRISQRAVENLASVGGGGAGALLSSGMLQFFEVFSYDRIGLRCVLRDGICSMSGAGRATDGPLGQGYYIVKGSGLPRIDVVGYRERVSWSRLVSQLAEITRGRTPAVE